MTESGSDLEGPSINGAEAEAEALAHAWAWFTLHSGQRMQSISYFLVGIALVVAGYGTAYQGKNFVVAAAISVVGAGLAIVFWMLDQRTKQLVKAAEGPLEVLESRLAARANLPSLSIVANVERPSPRTFSYSKLFRALMLIVLALMLLALVAAIVAGLLDASVTPTPPNPIHSGPPFRHP